VLGFFVLTWTSLVAIFAAAPEVYYQAPKLSSAGAGLLFFVAISAFIVLLGVGVVRRWRWTFWLIVVAGGYLYQAEPYSPKRLEDEFSHVLRRR
jgi:hypothetical protein